MILVNTETIPGCRIVRLCGLAQGNTIRAKDIGRDIGAGLKNLVGGELKSYTALMVEARNEATSRMVGQAQQMGANAVLNVRYTTSQVAGGAAELYAYGTAVVVEQAHGAPVQPPTGFPG
ncbi:MAG TPA: YbjQ family protein [Euzebya sp.]|nr:YbjQ family protein [Euzebya sp.]